MTKTLDNFLKEKTDFSDLGNESKIIKNEIYGEEIGRAINENKLLEFSLELSDSLPEMNIYKACIVANFIGFACEELEDTGAGEKVIGYFVKVCEHVKRFFTYFEDENGEIEFPEDFDSKKIYERDSEAVEAYYGFNALCVAVMAFISRDSRCRQYLRQSDINNIVSFIDEEVPETEQTRTIFYINRVQYACSRIPLLILDMENRKGIVAEANDLNNCFHLLFLLEEMIYNNFKSEYGMEDYTVDEVLSDFASGEYPDITGKSYELFFTEYNYGEYIREQKNKDSKNPDINEKVNNLIWGEMPPENIPQLDGKHIILIRRNDLKRGFSPEFLFVDHTSLKPYVKFISTLEEKEFDKWEKKIRTMGNLNEKEKSDT